MRSFHFRPRLERFEDRLTPAVSAAAADQTMAGAVFFQHVLAGDPSWMRNPALHSFVQDRLQTIFNQSEAAATAFGSGGGIGSIAQENAAMAQELGNWVGIALVPNSPGVPSPPPPAAPPTDAGMTGTMPDPNAPNWVALGAAGLKTWDVAQGSGAPLAAGGSVTVFYTGWLAANGTKFDARRSPAAPATFALSGLIQGWQQGLLGMKPGGIRRLFVPAALGYGAAGSPPSIPANADLVFEIKLVSHT